jgi:UDP-GlcNAc:undecaprenyl-phosphate GlcNAc-1-phosphate transferase
MVWQGWQLSFFVDLPLVTAAASIVWIVGLINTFNMLDNMDGLAAGIAAIVVTILAAVILTASGPVSSGPQLFVGGFLLVFLGAVLGFLWHNTPPAKLFMGDAGSYFVGFCIAIATISATFAGESTPEYAILAPLCVLAIPFYDTVTVIWIRCREGHSLFEGDTSHISHRLVEAGMSRKGAVYILYLATAACGLGAFALHLVDSRGAVLILLGIGGLLWLIGYWELGVRRRQQQRKADTANGPPE